MPNEVSVCSSGDSNRNCFKYKPKALPLDLTCSVRKFCPDTDNASNLSMRSLYGLNLEMFNDAGSTAEDKKRRMIWEYDGE